MTSVPRLILWITEQRRRTLDRDFINWTRRPKVYFTVPLMNAICPYEILFQILFAFSVLYKRVLKKVFSAWPRFYVSNGDLKPLIR